MLFSHGALYILQERAKAEKINRKLRQQLADFRVPEVMEYVTEKADLYELQKKVKSWERKVEIAEVKCLSNKNDIFDLTQTWCTMYQHELLLDSFWMVTTVVWVWICIFSFFRCPWRHIEKPGTRCKWEVRWKTNGGWWRLPCNVEVGRITKKQLFLKKLFIPRMKEEIERERKIRYLIQFSYSFGI